MVPVEAICLENTKESIEKCLSFVFGTHVSYNSSHGPEEQEGIMLPNFYGGKLIKFGDYFVKNSDGDVTPCAAEKFKKKYKLRGEE